MTEKTNRSGTAKGVAAAATALATANAAAAAEAEDKFLAGIRSDDEEANYAAWSTADQVEPSVIPALCALLASKKPNVRKASDEALKRIVHSVGKTVNPSGLGANTGRPDDPGRMDQRQQVVRQLVAVLTGDKREEIEKVTVLRHLSLIGTTDDVAKVAPFLNDPRLREEAAFCLERIPGKVAEEALLEALPAAADEFKPRILAALGHRGAEEAVGACIEAMGSEDGDIAIAGMKAWARIGASTGDEVSYPSLDNLSEWQRIEFDDSLLRYADAQLERGNGEEAEALYLEALDREEGHIQCAAIIGLAKAGTAQAAAAIFPKLRSEEHIVRITAQQAWESLAEGGAEA